LSSATEIAPSWFWSNLRKAFSAASACAWALSASRDAASALSLAAMERSLSISLSASSFPAMRSGDRRVALVELILPWKLVRGTGTLSVRVVECGATTVNALALVARSTVVIVIDLSMFEMFLLCFVLFFGEFM